MHWPPARVAASTSWKSREAHDPVAGGLRCHWTEGCSRRDARGRHRCGGGLAHERSPSETGCVMRVGPRSAGAGSRALGGRGPGQVRCVQGKVVEEPSTLAEQHRPELNLYGVEDPGLEGLLGGVGAVHEDVAVAGGCFGLLHAGGDAIGDVVDLLERVLGRCPVGRNEDRHAVVMVAVPVAGEVPGPLPGDHRAGGQRLVKHDLAIGVAGSERLDAARVAAAPEPVHEAHAVDAGRVLGIVVRSGDEPVQRHRHGHVYLRHCSSIRWRDPGLLMMSVSGMLPGCAPIDRAPRPDSSLPRCLAGGWFFGRGRSGCGPRHPDGVMDGCWPSGAAVGWWR